MTRREDPPNALGLRENGRTETAPDQRANAARGLTPHPHYRKGGCR